MMREYNEGQDLLSLDYLNHLVSIIYTNCATSAQRLERTFSISRLATSTTLAWY